MKRSILAIGFALALASTASAADMATKAAPVTGYPYAASGFYFGVGASATAASATVANTGLVAAGAGLDGVIGYQWKGGLDFMALEADFTYTNIGNAGTCQLGTTVTSCSAGDQWEIEPLFKFGFPVSTITAVLPNISQYFPALPSLPAGLTPNGTAHPYLYAGAPIKDVSANYGLAQGSDWTVQPEIGAGVLQQWTNGLAVDLRAGCTLGNTGFGFGSGVHTGNVSLGTSCTSRIEALY